MYEKFDDTKYNNAFSERSSFPQCLSCALPGGGFNPVSGFYNIAYGPTSPILVVSETDILTLAYKGALIDVNSVTSYRHDATSGDLNVAGSSIPFEAVHSGEGGKTWAEELQAVSHLNGMFNGMLGFSASGDTGFADLGVSGALLHNIPGMFTSNTIETHSYSVFGELYAQPIERLKFTLGLRSTDDHRTLNGTDSQNGAAVLGGGPAATSLYGQATFSEVTPRLVVAYDFGSVNLYASYNRGFKEGGFNAPVFTNEAPVKPETVDYYEAGAKFISPDNRLRLNAAVYYYKYKNIQVSILDVSTGVNVLENAAAARAYGGEFEASSNVAQWLNVFGNISLLNSQFTSYPAAAVVDITPTGIVPGVENLDGFRLPRAPSVLSSFGGDLHAPIADHLTAHLNAVAHYTSSYDFSPGASGSARYARQDPYWVVNLSG
jgi:iron complex outermembrane recepter protein